MRSAPRARHDELHFCKYSGYSPKKRRLTFDVSHQQMCPYIKEAIRKGRENGKILKLGSLPSKKEVFKIVDLQSTPFLLQDTL